MLRQPLSLARVKRKLTAFCMSSSLVVVQPVSSSGRFFYFSSVSGFDQSLSGELHDFLTEDLRSWYPELASSIKLTLVEAMPSVLPMFSKQLIDYTVSTFKEEKIDVLTGTKVKEVGQLLYIISIYQQLFFIRSSQTPSSSKLHRD